MTPGILELTIILGVAAILGLLARILKQPTILAYILTGVVVGAFGISHIQNAELFATLSALGIMFLLFLIGMEMNYDSLRLVGKASLMLGLGQIIFTAIGGFFIAVLLGFPFTASLYIAIALTFSSTVIIIKLLSEKGELYSLHGKLSIGFLLVQDFAAMLILLVLAGMGDNSANGMFDVASTLVKGIILFILMMVLGRRTIPFLMEKISRSMELLFLTSLAWCLGVATVVSYSGFPIEIGGFLAGIALANSSERYEISSRIKPLRDFFVLIFFVILGAGLVFSDFTGLSLPILLFSLFVLLGNPLIVIIIMGVMGYRNKTSFMTGITVAQISEFSLIIAALGLRLGHINMPVVSLITAVGILTITISTYIITYSDRIFVFLEEYLKIFERRNLLKDDLPTKTRYPLVLVGAHRLGQNLASMLPKEKLLVVDFDPEIIKNLKSMGFTALFGDINDEDIKEEAGFGQAEMVICTSPNLETNEDLLEDIKQLKKRPVLILRAELEDDAKMLYKKDADYVIIPHLTAGHTLGKQLADVGFDPGILKHLKEKDLSYMEKSVPKSG